MRVGPHLICDKSTIQGLSRPELNVLRRYYTLNVPPVLLLEILGDLKKADDVDACRETVRSLADRLVPACSRMNVEFRELILGEMSGASIAMNGVPVVAGGKNVVSDQGKRGMIIEKSEADNALIRWQSGAFLEAETLLAANWRHVTKSIDLEKMQRQLRKEYSGRLNLTSISSASEFVDDVMASASPDILIEWFLDDADIGPEELRREIVQVARSCTFSLESELPFTAYCLRTALIFHFCLAFKLIGTRPTNRVDLEYFYYSPFCWAFSSGDNLHRDLAPYVLRHGQTFIPREAIKADLKSLALWWGSLNEEEKKAESSRVGPPESAESPTFQLWTNRMKPGFRDAPRLQDEMPSERAKEMMAYVQGLLKSGSPIPDSGGGGSINDYDFVVMRQDVRVNGPCICGSELNFGDCCGKKISK